MDRVRDSLHRFNKDQSACWNDRLVPELEHAGISILSWKKLRKTDREFADAVVDAVKQWRFQPSTLNGHAASMQTVITINFSYPPG